MPAGMDYVEFFGLDSMFEISVDNSPRFEGLGVSLERTELGHVLGAHGGVTVDFF